MEIKQDGLLIMHGHLAPTTITYQIASGKSDLGTVARALSMIIPLSLEAVKSRGGEAEDLDSSNLEGGSSSDEGEVESYAPSTVTLGTAGALKSTRLLI